MKEPNEIARSLLESLESTQSGLRAFLASLRNSQMSEALDGYRGLQLILVQQRLWAINHGRTELMPHFDAVAKIAGEIHDILAPYAALMQLLSRLHKVTVDKGGVHNIADNELFKDESRLNAKGPSKRPHVKDAQSIQIVELLLTHGPLSVAKMASLLDCERQVLQVSLRELTDTGIVFRKGRGGGISYRISEQIARHFSEVLSNVVDEEDSFSG